MSTQLYLNWHPFHHPQARIPMSECFKNFRFKAILSGKSCDRVAQNCKEVNFWEGRTISKVKGDMVNMDLLGKQKKGEWMDGLPMGSDQEKDLEYPHFSVPLFSLNSLNFWGHAIRKGYNSFVFQELPSPSTAGCSSTKNMCKQSEIKQHGNIHSLFLQRKYSLSVEKS